MARLKKHIKRKVEDAFKAVIERLDEGYLEDVGIYKGFQGTREIALPGVLVSTERAVPRYDINLTSIGNYDIELKISLYTMADDTDFENKREQHEIYEGILGEILERKDLREKLTDAVQEFDVIFVKIEDISDGITTQADLESVWEFSLYCSPNNLDQNVQS